MSVKSADPLTMRLEQYGRHVCTTTWAEDLMFEAAQKIRTQDAQIGQAAKLLAECIDHAYGNDSEEWLIRIEAFLQEMPAP